MGRRWTKAEILLLGTQPDALAARTQGRSVSSVCTKRWKLLLPPVDPAHSPWTEADDRITLAEPVAETASA